MTGLDEDEVRRRLAAAVGRLPFEPPDAEPLRAEGRRRRRNRRIVSATGGLALSLAVVAGVIAVGPGQSASPTPAPAVHQPSRLPSAPARPVTTPSSPAPSAVATSTVDPTAPVRVAYVNATGVWIAAFDPTTAHQLGAPVRVSDAFPLSVTATDLQFSPEGRYLTWIQYSTPSDGISKFALYDGEKNRHFTVAPPTPGATGSITATGTGAYLVSGLQARTIDHNGVVAPVPAPIAKGIPDVVGTYPGGFLVAQTGGVLRLPAGGDATQIAQGNPNMAAGDAAGTTVFTYSGGEACQTIAGWEVVHPDGTSGTVVFTKHPGRATDSLSVSPDGVVGGVVTDCGKGATLPTSFVELDGVVARTVATDVVAAAIGAHGIVGEVRGQNTANGITGDRHLRIYDAANQLVADLGGPVTALTFGPEHLP